MKLRTYNGELKWRRYNGEYVAACSCSDGRYTINIASAGRRVGIYVLTYRPGSFAKARLIFRGRLASCMRVAEIDWIANGETHT